MIRFTNTPAFGKRYGGTTTLTCLLLPLIVGMVAFAVDMSWLVLTRSELQNAADAAALAGANRLGDNYVLFSLPTQTSANKTTLISGAVSAATTAAQTYAAANSAGGVSSLTLLSSDIDVGYTDNSGNYTSNSTNPALYPNTIKVTMRRDSTANGSLSMFFAPAIGVSTVDVQAAATAMAYGGRVNSFRTNLGSVAGLLPITYDVNNWNSFISNGIDPDGNTNKDSSGNPTIQVYPSIKSPGNFGWISLNDSHVGASTLSGWITNGPANTDIQALVTNGLIPLSSHPANTWDWQGDTGFKASDVMTVNANVGNTYIIPLFTPYTAAPSYSAGSGNGSHYYYDIVAFVGVTIMQPSDTNKQVVVQPAPITDPNMILDPSSVAPLSSSGNSSVTALAPPKLTN
jgi:Flp pilus assembly protein TadG